MAAAGPGFRASSLVQDTAGPTCLDWHPVWGEFSLQIEGSPLLGQALPGGTERAKCLPEVIRRRTWDPSLLSTPISISGPSPFPRKRITILYSKTLVWISFQLAIKMTRENLDYYQGTTGHSTDLDHSSVQRPEKCMGPYMSLICIT